MKLNSQLLIAGLKIVTSTAKEHLRFSNFLHIKIDETCKVTLQSTSDIINSIRCTYTDKSTNGETLDVVVFGDKLLAFASSNPEEIELIEKDRFLMGKGKGSLRMGKLSLSEYAICNFDNPFEFQSQLSYSNPALINNIISKFNRLLSWADKTSPIVLYRDIYLNGVASVRDHNYTLSVLDRDKLWNDWVCPHVIPTELLDTLTKLRGMTILLIQFPKEKENQLKLKIGNDVLGIYYEISSRLIDGKHPVDEISILVNETEKADSIEVSKTALIDLLKTLRQFVGRNEKLNSPC